MKLKVAVLLAAFALIIVPAADAHAATTTTPSNTGATSITNNANSLLLSPVRTDIALDPGTSKVVPVTVQNLNPVTVQVKAVISDFAPNKDETGTPEVLLDDTKYAESHSLKRLASASPAVVTLKASERATINVTVTAPGNAMAGGYYGAVRFESVNDPTLSGNGVSFSTNVGSLMLLRINGDTKEKVSLASLDVRQDPNKFQTFFTKPDNIIAVARFKNDGNVQEQPFGKVALYKGKKLIQEVEVNNTDPRGNVLPDSIRRFDVKLDKVGKFGKYTLKGNFGWGTSGQVLTNSVTFWVVPIPYIVSLIVLIVLLIGLAVVLPIMLRAYNRRILAKARGRRRY